MRLLFITTLGQSLAHEHIFTRNLWLKLRTKLDASLLTIYIGDAPIGRELQYNETDSTYSLWVKNSVYENWDKLTDFVAQYFSQIAPTVIHSNMIEGFEIEAASKAKIPIVLTMHIGGLLCPRGGGNGLLRWDDTICDGTLSKDCVRCCCQDLPLSNLGLFISNLIPIQIKETISKKVSGKNIFYVTPLLNIDQRIKDREKVVGLLKNATVIAANDKLSQTLTSQGIRNVVIKHGIKNFPKLDFPLVKGSKIKFFFLGRVQYSKGLHVLLQALEGISSDFYELHVFGDAYPARHEQMYKSWILKLARKCNVTFHGFVENDELQRLLAEMHVMIHPAIFHEVYGINISEALSMGKPVLATKCGGAEMQVIDNFNGWLVNPNDVQEMHEKISEIILHADDLTAISENCCCPNTLDNYVTELNNLYTTLAN